MTTIAPLSKITWIFLALTIVFHLLANPAIDSSYWWDKAPPPVVHGKVMPSRWWEEVKRSCKRFHVSPFFAAAVMRIEGNGWTEQRIRHSPYWGPMGINEYCPVPSRVLMNPLSNIRVGVAALRGGDRQAVLKRYNAEWFKDNYIRDVLALERQLEREARVKVNVTAAAKGIGPSKKDSPQKLTKKKRETNWEMALKSNSGRQYGSRLRKHIDNGSQGES